MSDDKASDANEVGTNSSAISVGKPTFLDWIDAYLPFKIPRIPLPQTAKNLDKAVARLIDARSDNAVANMEANSLRRRALTEGEISFIEAGIRRLATEQEINRGAEALSYILEEAEIGRKNRESILKIAVDNLNCNIKDSDAPEQISDDWLNTFSRIASDKSDSDIQQLWGKLLSGEIRSPGSVRLRTLAQLAMFDKDDANFAQEFLRYAINRSLYTMNISRYLQIILDYCGQERLVL